MFHENIIAPSRDDRPEMPRETIGSPRKKDRGPNAPRDIQFSLISRSVARVTTDRGKVTEMERPAPITERRTGEPPIGGRIPRVEAAVISGTATAKNQAKL
jgi:hypothetical protein